METLWPKKMKITDFFQQKSFVDKTFNSCSFNKIIDFVNTQYVV